MSPTQIFASSIEDGFPPLGIILVLGEILCNREAMNKTWQQDHAQRQNEGYDAVMQQLVR